MNNIFKLSVPVLAAAISLACGNAVAQDDPASSPDVAPRPEGLQAPRPAEPWQPDAERVPARPEQVEEAIDELLDPEFDPSNPDDNETDPIDTDRTNSGPPTDDRMAGERIDSTLQDEVTPTDDDELEDTEAADKR